ncbi:Crp/Fnr family transcriptional regulator [Croceimicrobium hydrocarbonivorans]|uniref:Crp/Fnr family transcriptional regulator n=1 Tax=Croceimicrobium hydrocarbonivorans TaxID=2761580 RepID=A0A7H0VHL3_9FLAO|nr:Crp/Fnr family transcriptional regulator [Croceimicrobium hydrocarbonivorans]QNR25211.1 Crp/Fnr family transcriptional regulator [Croceimicrobium hydrocarbonivorans]
MLAQTLKQSFDHYFEAPIEAWLEFAEFCEPIRFKKDEVIKAQGTAERYFYFIIEGSAGVFLWKNHNFVCLDFALEKSACCDYMSLLTGESTELEIVALEKSEMIRMPRAEFHRLGQKSVGRVIMQMTAEASFIEKQQQQIELLTKNAEERYHILQKRFPGIELRIAQKHIASYLGITPQSLSRLRKLQA